MISFVNPQNGNHLYPEGTHLIDSVTKEKVADIINEIPRFVSDFQNYAGNFGYQWNKWNSILSDARNSRSNDAKYKLLLARTRFDSFDTKGKSILECGCGGGDDTEVLLKFDFEEICSFDISSSVDRAKKYISDSRVSFSQASIFQIPYAESSFDFVFCHRVLQHTPDPEGALISVAKMVKPHGVLFVHSYHDTPNYMRSYKYKYRFITKRLPHQVIEKFLNYMAPSMHWLNKLISKHHFGRLFSRRFVPLEYYKEYASFTEADIIELEKLVTFDALTPQFDKPMKWQTMKSIVEGLGFEIKYYNSNPAGSPIYLTAVRS